MEGIQVRSGQVRSGQVSPSTEWVKDEGWGWGYAGRFSRDPVAVFFCARDHPEQFQHGQGCPLLDVVRPAFPLPTAASPTHHGVLKNGFGETVVACDMPEPCEFLSLASCQKKLL